MSLSELNRRTLMAGAATAAAVALPATVAADAAIVAGMATAAPLLPLGDVSFPELAARLAAVAARWQRQRALDRADTDKIARLVTEATGTSSDDAPARGEPGYDRYEETRRRIVREYDFEFGDPVDEQGCSIAWNEIDDERFPLVEEILAMPVRSVADIVLQAQAFLLAEPFDIANSNLARRLVENILAAAGVKALPAAGVLS
jgi:hypothetical protein